MHRKPFAAKIDEDLVDRVRSAAAAMQSANRRYTLAQLVEDALRAHVEGLERQHNHGRRFPSIEEPLKRGRRIGG